VSTVTTVVVVADPELTNCFLVASPHALVRLCPSHPPMNDYYTAHFLVGSPPTPFAGRSMLWRTKDEMVALLRANGRSSEGPDIAATSH
jgi:hypothetical protein